MGLEYTKMNGTEEWWNWSVQDQVWCIVVRKAKNVEFGEYTSALEPVVGQNHTFRTQGRCDILVTTVYLRQVTD